MIPQKDAINTLLKTKETVSMLLLITNHHLNGNVNVGVHKKIQHNINKMQELLNNTTISLQSLDKNSEKKYTAMIMQLEMELLRVREKMSLAEKNMRANVVRVQRTLANEKINRLSSNTVNKGNQKDADKSPFEKIYDLHKQYMNGRIDQKTYLTERKAIEVQEKKENDAFEKQFPTIPKK